MGRMILRTVRRKAVIACCFSSLFLLHEVSGFAPIFATTAGGTAATTKDVIAPADRSGIPGDFKVTTNVHTAVVALQDKAGKNHCGGQRWNTGGSQGGIRGRL